MIWLFLMFFGIANATGIYSDIPKTFKKKELDTREIKFGYNLTNNLAQKQSLFFIEGTLQNQKINHTSRYQYSEAKTEDNNNATIAYNTSDLFRTNTLLPFIEFKDAEEKEVLYSISGTLYGRYFNFVDKILSTNSSHDTIYTAGIGASKANIYTVGLSVGERRTNQTIYNPPRETIIRPSLSYTNQMQYFVPKFIKTLLHKNSVFGFVTTETSIKIEYALVSGKNTHIEQFYIGVEKKILKNLALAVFYDRENTRNRFITNNANKIERFSTSLVLSL